jgi:hypothetical protein
VFRTSLFGDKYQQSSSWLQRVNKGHNAENTQLGWFVQCHKPDIFHSGALAFVSLLKKMTQPER